MANMPPKPAVALNTVKTPESEKITINMGFVDLGHIDLLVAEGFYSNRTDFIRTAIRTHLASHADVLRQAATRKMLVLGLQSFSVADLEAARDAGEKLQIRVLGLAVIDPNVSPALASAAIDSLTVLGALHASPAVKAALAGRIR
jgi:Arc/MetJ-type ribon-helix-helix transcriptional regulator